MRDSLTNRFRGAFLGMWLGETAIRPADWSLQTLAATDRWLAGRGLEQGAEPALARRTPFDLPPELLLIALLHHDQPQQMHQTLCAIPDAAEQPFELAAAVAQTLSLILRERFVASELIPQLIRDLELRSDLPLVQALLQVQSWLAQPDLAAVQSQVAGADFGASPGIAAVALPLYSFLSSPDHFQLSLMRLRRLMRLAPSASAAPAAAILGAISGLFGGLLGLPLQDGRQSGPPAEEFGLFQRADHLLICWSGAGSQHWQQPPYASLVAAPRIIRAG